MTILIGFFMPLIFGVLITFLLDDGLRKVERLALGILLGFAFQTFFMFIFYMFGFRFTLRNSIIEVFLLSAVCLILILLLPSKRKRFFDLLNFKELWPSLSLVLKSHRRVDIAIKVMWLIVSGFIVSSLMIGAFFPVYGWDSLVLYNFRAVTFAATGGMEDGISRGYFFGYPLMTSLAHTWMYFFNSNPHIFYWGIYVGFVLIIYFCLEKYLSKFTLVLTVLILASLPSIYTGSYFDYTNFPYLVYLVSGILYVCRYIKEKNKSYLVISAILTGLSTWVRQTEPFWVINLLFIVVMFFSEFKKRAFFNLIWLFLCLGIFFGIQQPWRLYEVVYIGGGRNITDQAGYAFKSLEVFNLTRLIDVIVTTVSKTIPTWQPYLLIAFFVSIFAKNNIKKAGMFLYFVLANIALLFLGTYIFSYIWPENWKAIIDSQQRLSSFIVPLLIVYTAIVSDDYIGYGKNIVYSLIKKGVKKITD